MDKLKFSINQKYKKIAFEISQDTMHQSSRFSIDHEKNLIRKLLDTLGGLDSFLGKYDKDMSLLEISSKNQLISSIHMQNNKMSKEEINESPKKINEKNHKDNLKDMLDSMSEIAYEPSVNLSDNISSRNIIKTQNIMNSLSLSKILKSNEEKSEFAQRILVSNQYEQITPLWGKRIVEGESISAEEFHEN